MERNKFGFRSRRGTRDAIALVTMIGEINQEIETGSLFFIDLERTFDWEDGISLWK